VTKGQAERAYRSTADAYVTTVVDHERL